MFLVLTFYTRKMYFCRCLLHYTEESVMGTEKYILFGMYFKSIYFSHFSSQIGDQARNLHLLFVNVLFSLFKEKINNGISSNRYISKLEVCFSSFARIQLSEN